MLFYRVEFWAVWWEIGKAQRFAALTAKRFDGFSSMPWCVINKKDKARVLFEHRSNKPNECSLCLSCDELENKFALCSHPDNMESFARVVGFHDGATAF